MSIFVRITVLPLQLDKVVYDVTFHDVSQVHRRMLVNATTTWSQNRWQDWVYIIQMALDQAPQGQEQMLWDAAEITQQQSWDWDAYYSQTGVGHSGAYVGKKMAKFPEASVRYWTMWDHGVNNAMATKGSPAPGPSP